MIVGVTQKLWKKCFKTEMSKLQKTCYCNKIFCMFENICYVEEQKGIYEESPSLNLNEQLNYLVSMCANVYI